MSESGLDGLGEYDWNFLVIALFIIPVWIPSLIGVIFHLYKFCNSSKPASLPACTITFYCCFLSLLLFASLPILFLETSTSLIMQRAMVTAEYIKFMIVFDVLLTFYDLAFHSEEPSSDARNETLVYYFLSTSMPVLYSIVVVFFESIGKEDDPHDIFFGPFAIAKFIRIVGISVIIVALCIRLINKSTNGIWKTYGVHLRVLVIIGGLSILISVAEAFYDAADFKIPTKMDFAEPYCWEYFLEGLIIGLFAL